MMLLSCCVSLMLAATLEVETGTGYHCAVKAGDEPDGADRGGRRYACSGSLGMRRRLSSTSVFRTFAERSRQIPSSKKRMRKISRRQDLSFKPLCRIEEATAKCGWF